VDTTIDPGRCAITGDHPPTRQADPVLPRQGRSDSDEWFHRPEPATALEPVEQRPAWDHAGWVIPLVVAAILGGWRLTVPALWADELATWGAVRLSWSQLWDLSGSVDAVLTPYYVVMKAYATVAGTSTAALRLPALVAIVAATGVVTALGRRVGGAGTGLAAGLIFAILPVMSRYAQEARPYAFLMLFAALSVLCLIRLRDKPSPLRAGAYAVVVLLAGLCHPLGGLLLITGHLAAVAWWQVERGRTGRRTTVSWIAAAAVGAAPAVALLMVGSQQMAQVSWIQRLGLDSFQAIPAGLFFSASAGGLALTLAVLGVRREPALTALAFAAFVPTVLLLVAGTQTEVWVARYVVGTVPAFAVVAAAAATRFGTSPAVAVVALAGVLAFPQHINIRDDDGHAQASARVADVISPRQRAGDVVVFPDTHASIPWSPRDIYERYLSAPRPPDVLRTAGQRTDGRLLARECPEAACLGTPDRIWIIRVDSAGNPLKDMSPAKRDRIGTGYRVVQRWSHPLLVIVLLERKPA
jgi:mannosyltransferase